MRSIYVTCRRLLLFFCIFPAFLISTYGQCDKVIDLGVSDVSENAATLQWTSNASMAVFEVEVRSKGRTPKFKQTYNSNESGLRIDSLVPGSEYRFRVRTNCSTDGSSGSTKWFVFETAGMSPNEDCPKATELQLVGATMTTATLTWTGSQFSSHYEVEVRSKGNTPVYFFEKSLLDTSITIFGLDPNGSYHFRVRSTCINGAVSGSTSWFDFLPGSGNEQESCPFVENLMADSITSSSVIIVWSTGGPNTVYELLLSDGLGNDLTIAPANSPQFIQGLSPDTEYSLSLVAHCETGIPSQVNLTFTTEVEMTDSCQTPVGLDAVAQDSNAFLLSWDVVDGAESYNLQIGDLDSLPMILVDTNITSAFYLFGTMDSLQGYTFRVQALCSTESMSTYSDYFFFPVAADSLVLACDTPMDLNVDTVIGNNVVLSWSSTSASTYELLFQNMDTSFSRMVHTTSVPALTLVSELTPMTTYDVSIRANCGREEGILSTPANFTTGEAQVICLPVDGLMAERLDDNTASLTWNGPDSATYVVEVKSDDPASTSSLIIPAVDPELIVSGLDPLLGYQFRVRTVCSAGDTSMYTNWVGFSTLDTSPEVCDAPTDIVLDSITSTEAWISWQGIDTLEYRVLLKDRDTLVPYEEYLTSEHFIYFDSLMPETNYELFVQTLCDQEESILSEKFFFSTLMIQDTMPDSLCIIPENIQLDSVGATDAWISWEGDDSLLYYVEVNGPSYEFAETVGATSIWLSDLPDDGEFILKVRTICSESDSSDWSDDFIFQTLELPMQPDDSCSVPIAELLSISEISATGSWTSSSSGAFYLLEIENIGFTSHYRLITTTRDTVFTFDDLMPGGSYQWKVAAFCADGTYSDCTPWMVFETEGSTNCPAPSGLGANMLTATGALLSWDTSASAIDYEVEIQSLDTTLFYDVSSIVTVSEFEVTDLAAGGNYQFKVNVQCLDGTISEDSDWFTFSTLTSQDTGQIAASAYQSVNMVYPNPVRQTMKVRIPEELTGYPAVIELSDMMGRVILIHEEPNVNGGDEVQIAVHTLGDGVYQMSVKSQNRYFHELVMIMR